MIPSAMLESISRVLLDSSVFRENMKTNSVKHTEFSRVIPESFSDDVYNIADEVFISLNIRFDTRANIGNSPKTKFLLAAINALYTGNTLMCIIWLIKSHYKYPKRKLEVFNSIIDIANNTISSVNGSVPTSLNTFNLYFIVDQTLLTSIIKTIKKHKL